MNWLRARLRAWLGIVEPFNYDPAIEQCRQAIDATRVELGRVIPIAYSANDRLRLYERDIPAIARVRRDELARRQRIARVTDVALPLVVDREHAS